jgi:hypothetical protein
MNEQSLAEIALALDERERAVMAENGMDSAEFRAFAGEASGNVALDGNFSVQVRVQPPAAGRLCAPAGQRRAAVARNRGGHCAGRGGTRSRPIPDMP